MTLDPMVGDALAVPRYLRERFGEEKVYLVGNSWGTILGVLAVQRQPELYHAPVGTGKRVDPVAELRDNGPPPHGEPWKYEPAL